MHLQMDSFYHLVVLLKTYTESYFSETLPAKMQPVLADMRTGPAAALAMLEVNSCSSFFRSIMLNKLPKLLRLYFQLFEHLLIV